MKWREFSETSSMRAYVLERLETYFSGEMGGREEVRGTGAVGGPVVGGAGWKAGPGAGQGKGSGGGSGAIRKGVSWSQVARGALK